MERPTIVSELFSEHVLRLIHRVYYLLIVELTVLILAQFFKVDLEDGGGIKVKILLKRPVVDRNIINFSVGVLRLDSGGKEEHAQEDDLAAN